MPTETPPDATRIPRAPREAAPRHPVLDRSRCLVYAHRGGSALRPENTMCAFEHGVAVGADGLELDVHLSKDAEVVVIHDDRLDRTTDHEGPVARLTARELAEVDAGYSFEVDGQHPFRGRHIGVPTLRDVIDRFPDIPLIIELKGADVELARSAVRVAREAGALWRICFGSFEDVTIRAARACGPDVVTSAAKEEIRRALRASWIGLGPWRPAFQALQVPERYGVHRVATRRFIRAAVRTGLALQVWVVDGPEDMRRLLGWGAQGIITDRPDVAVPTVRDHNAARPAAGRA